MACETRHHRIYATASGTTGKIGAAKREKGSLGFATMPDTNCHVQSQKKARSLKFWI